ncbi:hypothetical protein GUITHDRAFT_152903 [Guillardia theta CCMP2712]|uniref:Malic enzyme n=2 Tax=Guillardia theta TaxID=55529 RepID=L1J7S4_GUITC|nr:hypothetical protein GUITHDRAFT_152903 [Guillardia theta CCMP2712]EKX44581.1 hypothetical protein GUITHDRAFT_152903 [Guillardia theta CCMP2712]|eukprot:XP_005831561.1 hypothetical protein GUITHDRAFT_152903 [Guillardia theta CCMP2712]
MFSVGRVIRILLIFLVVHIQLISGNDLRNNRVCKTSTNPFSTFFLSLQSVWRRIFSCKSKESAGYHYLKHPINSKSLSTSKEERDAHRLRGLLPAGQISLEVQIDNAMEQLRSKSNDLEKYIYLQTIQDGSEDLYFGVLGRNLKECMPLVYTPTVGQACIQWHQIYRHTPRGIYLSIDDIGHVEEALSNWPQQDVKVIVVTDGERILGLGDLGVNGMGIPVGKLALYTACGGIDPKVCLPVHIDVGTNNIPLRSHPAYMGLRSDRVRGEKYYDLLQEFIRSVQKRFGRTTLIQFEDFGNTNAFDILNRFRDQATCFNDDIQGTAAVALAGLISSEKLTNIPLSRHTILFYGAGEAGTGIADLIAKAISKELGSPVSEARKKIWMMDSKGLITSKRENLAHHKLAYAHESASECTTLEDCVEQIKPSVLIGVSAVPGSFTKSVVEKMSAMNEKPVIFALSNPTSKAECTSEDAYTWTSGRCIFASGSPMPSVTLTLPSGESRTLEPGQGNNAYIFPGLGLGIMAAEATAVDDEALLVAANALARQVGDEQLKKGNVYPELDSLKSVSAKIAEEVAEHFFSVGLSTSKKPGDLTSYIKSLMYEP